MTGTEWTRMVPVTTSSDASASFIVRLKVWPLPRPAPALLWDCLNTWRYGGSRTPLPAGTGFLLAATDAGVTGMTLLEPISMKTFVKIKFIWSSNT